MTSCQSHEHAFTGMLQILGCIKSEACMARGLTWPEGDVLDGGESLRQLGAVLAQPGVVTSALYSVHVD